MSRLAAHALAVLAAAATLAGARRAGRGFLTIGSDMQPQVVAQTLAGVEEEWRAGAASFAECNTTGAACDEAPRQFERSCSTIAGAVLQASSGDQAVVQEYLSDVCGEPQLDGWRRQLCQEFSGALSGAMTGDAYKNREDLDTAALCRAFWLRFVDGERERTQRERDAQASRLKAQEAARAEAEQRAAAERTEAERKAAADAAAQEQRRAAEAQRRAAEAQAAQAAQAGVQADEAATRAAAEAEKEAAEVEQSVAEAQASVEEAEGQPRNASAAPQPQDEAGALANATAVGGPK